MSGGTAQARRRERRLLVGALLAVTVLAVVLALVSGRRPERVVPLDSRSPAGPGALGLYEAAARLGWRPARERLPLPTTEATATYVAIHATHGVDARDAGRLLAAVRGGAGLVVDVRGETDPLSDSLGVATGFGRPWVLDNRRAAERLGVAAALRRPGCTRRLTDELQGTEAATFVMYDSSAGPAAGRRVFVDAWRTAGPGGDSAARAGPGGVQRAAVMVGFPLGRGRVVAVSEGSMLANAALRTCWAAAGPAAVRALEWVSPAAPGGSRRPLLFLEGRRSAGGGARARPGALRATWRALTEVPAGRALAQGLGAALVLLAALGARALPPLPATRVERRSPREHVGALALAYREARATRLVARRLVRGLRRRHAAPGARAAAPADDDLAFLAAVAARHPRLAGDAERLAAAARAPVPPAALHDVGAAAARLDDALAAARRGVTLG